MKSGLYIAELVKRLYNSEGLKDVFPNSEERLKHISWKIKFMDLHLQRLSITSRLILSLEISLKISVERTLF